jgi:hypothetical protein
MEEDTKSISSSLADDINRENEVENISINDDTQFRPNVISVATQTEAVEINCEKDHNITPYDESQDQEVEDDLTHPIDLSLNSSSFSAEGAEVDSIIRVKTWNMDKTSN